MRLSDVIIIHESLLLTVPTQFGDEEVTLKLPLPPLFETVKLPEDSE